MAAGDLCSRSEVRAFLELPAADTGRDSLIDTTITAISAAITQYTQREFTPTASATRRFELPVGNLSLDLAPYDLRTVSTLRLHPEDASPDTLTATSDFQLEPVAAPHGVYTRVRFSSLVTLFNSDSARYFGRTQVEIAGAWGFASIPNDVKQAAIVATAASLRRDVPALDLGDVLDDPRQLSPDRPTNYALPAATIRMLSPYRRHGFK
jgi:hypothetical protein